MLLAMVPAAKADGAVDEAEIQRVVGHMDDDGVSQTERQFLLAELRKPLDLQALVEAVPNTAWPAMCGTVCRIGNHHLQTRAALSHICAGRDRLAS